MYGIPYITGDTSALTTYLHTGNMTHPPLINKTRPRLTVSVSLSAEELDVIDAAAAEVQQTRSEYMRTVCRKVSQQAARRRVHVQPSAQAG